MRVEGSETVDWLRLGLCGGVPEPVPSVHASAQCRGRALCQEGWPHNCQRVESQDSAASEKNRKLANGVIIRESIRHQGTPPPPLPGSPCSTLPCSAPAPMRGGSTPAGGGKGTHRQSGNFWGSKMAARNNIGAGPKAVTSSFLPNHRWILIPLQPLKVMYFCFKCCQNTQEWVEKWVGQSNLRLQKFFAYFGDSGVLLSTFWT